MCKNKGDGFIWHLSNALNAAAKFLMPQALALAVAHPSENPVVLCILKNEVYVVSDDEKDLATFQVKVMEDALYFEKLGVRPTASGVGYGSYCMKCIEKLAEKKSLKRVKMEVYDKSNHAIQFYEKRGYRKAGTDGTLKYTELIMEKEL